MTTDLHVGAGAAVRLNGLRKSFGAVTAVDGDVEQLADAIRRVHQGLRVVDPALAAETLATGESPLTGRERDVLVAARTGGTVADIARLLVLSDGTVRSYLSSAMGRTGARTRAEAVLIAEERGWL